MLAAILKNPITDCTRWETACKTLGIAYELIDTSHHDFIDALKKLNPDFCLSRSSGITQLNKKNYDEKIYIIEKHLGIPVYPSYNEIILHESKIMLSYFLKANNLPHPETFLSFDKAEALDFVEKTTFPLVAKTSNGAAGSGVVILNSKGKAISYIEKAFGEGIKRRFGPNRKTGTAKNWFLKAISSPQYLKKKLLQYRLRSGDVQKGYVLLQEYVEHDYEWRCVKIGESYFAYKKLRVGEKASGSKAFDYGAPPIELLDFTKDTCLKFGFELMAIDIFFSNGQIYVNEMQTLFGHKSKYICRVGENPGRYVFSNNKWEFEAGDFNENESYNLRVKEIIQIILKNKDN